MSYFLVEDFRLGLDLRKSAFTAPPGSLRRLVNAHITSGGEIEKAKAWTMHASLPPNTFGFHSLRDQLFVFGSAAAPSGLPGTIRYQRLRAQDQSAHMVRVLDTDNFNGRVYAVAEFSNGAVHHFYDGNRVTDWDDISVSITNNDTVAQALAQSLSLASPLQTTAVTTTITITAPDDDTALTVTGSVSGSSQTLTITQQQAPGPTQPAVWQVVVGGTFNAASIFTLNATYAGTPYQARVQAGTAGVGRTVLTLGDKVYSVTGSLLYFSGFTGTPPTPDPTAWDESNTGAGFINMATQSGGSFDLVGLGSYQNMLAVFSRRDTQIWVIDPDPDKNTRWQILDNVGAVAPNSIRAFGDVDLFFLSDTGVRSLRARDSSNIASAQDVGTPIDTEVSDRILSDPSLSRAPSALDPTSGRYMLTLGTDTLVFSHYPGAKISAWSFYTGPAFSGFAIEQGRMYGRAGDQVLLYGGPSGRVYPSDVVTEAWLPFMDAESPATQKSLVGLDVGCEGTWDVYLHPDPNQPDAYEHLGTLDGSTYGFQPKFSMRGHTTHFSLRFVHQGPGYARLANLAVHYDMGEAG